MYLCFRIQEGGDAPEDAPSGGIVELDFSSARLLVALFKGVSVLSSSLLDPTIIASTDVRVVPLNCCSRAFSLARTPSQNSSFFDFFFPVPVAKISTLSSGCRGAKPFSRYVSNSNMLGDAVVVFKGSWLECATGERSLLASKLQRSPLPSNLSRSVLAPLSLSDCIMSASCVSFITQRAHQLFRRAFTVCYII